MTVEGPTITLAEQNLVVHLFAPTDGPQAQAADEQIRRLWAAGRDVLAITEPVSGLTHLSDLPGQGSALPAGEPIAVAQDARRDRQMILRRAGGLLNLSVGLFQPRRGRRHQEIHLAADPGGWIEFTGLWDRICAGGLDALLGEQRLLVATVGSDRLPTVATGEPPEQAAAQRLAQLRREIHAALPKRVGRLPGWLRPTHLAGGFAIWDTGGPASASVARELVIVAPSDQDPELTRLVWTDSGGTDLPVLAQQLLHACELRYQRRILEHWQADAGRGPLGGRDLSPVQVLTTDPPAQRIESLENRVRALAGFLPAGRQALTELEKMLRAVGTALDDLRAGPGKDAALAGTAALSADLQLGEWLQRQIPVEVDALRADLSLAQELLQAAGNRLASEQALVPVARSWTAAPGRERPPRVFVSYARENQKHLDDVLALVNFLRDPAGIDVDIDQYHEHERLVWPTFVRGRIDQADFVMIIASPVMAWALDRMVEGRYRGVHDELAHLESRFKADPEQWRERILPVLLPGFTPDDLPPVAEPRRATHYPVTEFSESGAAPLLDRIRGVRRTTPPPLARPADRTIRVVTAPRTEPDPWVMSLLDAAGLTARPWTPGQDPSPASRAAVVLLPDARAGEAGLVAVLKGLGQVEQAFAGRVVVLGPATNPGTAAALLPDAVQLTRSAVAGSEVLRRLEEAGCLVDRTAAEIWLQEQNQ